MPDAFRDEEHKKKLQEELGVEKEETQEQRGHEEGIYFFKWIGLMLLVGLSAQGIDVLWGEFWMKLFFMACFGIAMIMVYYRDYLLVRAKQIIYLMSIQEAIENTLARREEVDES